MKKLLFILLFCMFGCFLSNLSAQEEHQNPFDVSLDSLLNIKISTASKYEQIIGEAPASVTIVTSSDIERYGYRTLAEVLSHEKGFYTSYDRNYDYVGVRGFGRPSDYNNRILLLYDGQPTNENVYGSAAIGTEFPIPIEDIEHVEIVRGPGSALYGTGAMFAVVNVITKKGNIIDGTRCLAEIGSFGRRQASFQFGKEWENKIDFSISGMIADNKGDDLYYQEYDDPSTNRGIAQGLDWDKYYGFYSTLSYNQLFINGYFTSRKKGVPTGSYNSIFNDSRAQTLDEYSGINIRYDTKLTSDVVANWTVSYQNYYYVGDYPISELQSESATGKRLRAEIRFQWDIQPEHRLTIGSEYHDNFKAEIKEILGNDTYYNKDFPFRLGSIYVEDEYQILRDLFLTLGVRHDMYSSVGSATTPRGALVYNFFDKQSTLKFLYGEGFRAPSIYESNYTDSISGYKSNSQINPENIETYEVVFEHRIGESMLGTLSYYFFDMDGLIDTWIDPADSFYQFKNIGDVYAHGIEAEINARFEPGIHFRLNYAFQIAKDEYSNVRISNSPQHIANLGISFPVYSLFSLGVTMQYQSERLTVYGSTTPSFFLANVNLRFQQRDGPLGAALLFSNIFNESYAHPASLDFKQAAIPQNGRSMIFNIWVKF